MATAQVKDLVLRSPAGSSEVITFTWPLQVGSGQDRHDNGIDIIDTIKFVCDELPSISSAFEEINLNKIDTACYKTMTNLVDRFNKAVDSIVALEKGTSLPTKRLNKFAHPSLLRHILQLVYNAAVLDPDKLNQYEPFSPEVYGETSYELVQQMIKHVNVSNEDTFIDLGSGVGQVVLQMAGSFPLKSCVGIEKADTPSQYADRMDVFFRQFMAWFGKRYCEYKLIKGDFLVDEHREKITSSSLVFVNNFAFGPNVDHQLKERFADLKDGARVVSSKSFCPLNFRITDRNLSDIGTIMHVSEIPPLKGSVSWTCKPVSYYLHVIDRTILERYFQRMKTQKGADSEHHIGGSTRTTRDRAKREVNGLTVYHHSHNSNSNSSSTFAATNRTFSPAISANTNNLNGKTRQQQQVHQHQHQHQQQQQQQRSFDMDTSTESDGDAVLNGNSNCSSGSNTRKVWSEWINFKDKSSQSDEEENNNNFVENNRVGNTRLTNAQKKRKKLTRKAAVANKTAGGTAGLQRDISAKERAELMTNIKDAASKDDAGANSTGGNSSTGFRGRKGRIKKGTRGRKSLKIVGLEILHKQTLLSTSVEALSKKLPPAPGCVDQQLTSLLTENMAHTELDIPTAPQDTPYALQILLDVFRSQYMAIIEQMKSASFVPSIQHQIQMEQERKQRIKNRASQLDKQIKVLIDDSVALLKVRMNELGISISSPNDLIAKAKEIVGRHKELQCIAKKIQNQVSTYELEQRNLLKRHLQGLSEYHHLYGLNGKNKLNELELSEATAHDLVLREIANTLSQRKKLVAQVSGIELETKALEKAAEEKRKAAALIAQGTNISHSRNPQQAHQSTALNSMYHVNNTVQTQQVMPTSTSTSKVPNPMPAVSKASVAHGRSGRRNRENRARSQEWPDVPDVAKIEESNPEVLAQKILETGRKIEAGKLNNLLIKHQTQGPANLQYNNQVPSNGKHQRSNSNELVTSSLPRTLPAAAQDTNKLMPAPKHRDSNNLIHTPSPMKAANGANVLPKCEFNNNVRKPPASISIQESPKVANFEDRLKSIITSALNEDQEHRKAQNLMHPLNTEVNANAVAASACSQKPPPPKRGKYTNSHLTAAHPPNNAINNIISAASHGVTNLNSTTTISPITAPLSSTSSTMNNTRYGGKSISTTSSINCMTTSAAMKTFPKYQQQALSNNNFISHGPDVGLGLQHRRNSVNVANYDNFMAGHQQHHHHKHFNANNQQQQQQQHYAAGHQGRSNTNDMMNYQQQAASVQNAMPMEFKTPVQENAVHYQQRSVGSREFIAEENLRNTSSHSDSPAPAAYFSNGREHGTANSQAQTPASTTATTTATATPQPPSRPGSNSSQPDYTQVSPAKMALRRHLSQEKLNQQLPASFNGAVNALPIATKTIGDLVNGEIERTLEITHQSIINAAVNMSTVGTASGERNHYLAERNLFSSELDRLIINNNAQRPERVNVRLVNESSNGGAVGEGNYSDLRKRSPTRGSKSPYAHNLATLAHVAHAAHQHKSANGPLATSNAITTPGTSSSSSSSLGSNQGHYVSSNREQRMNHIMPYNYASMGVGKETNSNCSEKDYKPVVLPRAEIKPCIEAYFHEEQQNQQNPNYAHKLHSVPSNPNSNKERRNNRLNGANPPLEGLAASLQDRMMASRKFKEENEERQRRAANANVPFTIRSASSNPTGVTGNDNSAFHNNNNNNKHHNNSTHIQQHQNQHHPAVTSMSHNYSAGGGGGGGGGSTPVKVEVGVKRTSPMPNVLNNHTRPPKIAHYDPSYVQQAQQNSEQNSYANAHSHAHSHLHTHNHSQYNRQYPAAVHNAAIMTPVNNNNTPAAYQQHLSYQDGNRMPSEPMVMTSDMNSMLNANNNKHSNQTHIVEGSRHDSHNSYQRNVHHSQHNRHTSNNHNHNHNHSQSQSHALHMHLKTASVVEGVGNHHPMVASRSADDDDIIAEDETQWQDRVSSGFDRLVAFASTELDKTRRSIDLDTVPASISCNTSPDSGITHSSLNSETSRTFLSTSSTSSQLDLPLNNGCSSSFLNHHPNGSSEHLSSDSSMKSENVCLPTIMKATCPSPADSTAIESPPLSDVGLPRTPSPSLTSIATPPLSHNQLENSRKDFNNLKIPLKYQRKSKTSSEKHYKKKFCERNWEYDCDEIMNYSNSSSNTILSDAKLGVGNATNQEPLSNGLKPSNTPDASNINFQQQQQQQMFHNQATAERLTHHYHHRSQNQNQSQSQYQQQSASHHKSSKFRPKGKDWDWSLDISTKNSYDGQTVRSDLSPAAVAAIPNSTTEISPKPASTAASTASSFLSS